MKNLLVQFKHRRNSIIFLILGFMIGIFIISFGISYIDGMNNVGKIEGLKENDYINLNINSSKKLIDLSKVLINLKIDKEIVIYKGINLYGVKGNLCGTLYDSALPYQPRIKKGNFLSASQSNSNGMLAVIGKMYKKDLYKKGTDYYIIINHCEYKVIGITSSSQDGNKIYIPYKAFMKIYGQSLISNFMLSIRKIDLNNNAVMNELYSNLNSTDVITNLNNGDMNYSYSSFFILGFAVLIIASINIISFTSFWIIDRKKEIALRKTTGATNKDIREQIFSEILSISLIALILALILQYIVCFFLNQKQLIEFYIYTSYRSIMIAFATALILSFIASFPPYIISTKIQPAIILKEE